MEKNAGDLIAAGNQTEEARTSILTSDGSPTRENNTGQKYRTEIQDRNTGQKYRTKDSTERQHRKTTQKYRTEIQDRKTGQK